MNKRNAPHAEIGNAEYFYRENVGVHRTYAPPCSCGVNLREAAEYIAIVRSWMVCGRKEGSHP